MEQYLQQSRKGGLGAWIAESVTVRLVIIGILVLLLLIPSSWVISLVSERQERQRGVVREIGQKWAGPQVLGGPVMVVPYREFVKTTVDKKETVEEVTRYLYLLPETLRITADAGTEVLHRGIFEAVVYQTHIRVNGTFAEADLRKLDVDPGALMWEKARMVTGVGDLKGLTNSPVFTLDGRPCQTETDFAAAKVFGQNLVVDPMLTDKRSTALAFSFGLDLRGSESLRFLHLGKDSEVTVSGTWPSPGFDGSFLPVSRTLTDSSFTATWQVPHYTRSLPQQWTAREAMIHEAPWEPAASEYDGIRMAIAPAAATEARDGQYAESFGVSFLQPVDHYQKTTRTAKYGILVILLTFVSLFFTEIVTRRQVHVVQYLLIGAAMIVYYCLLLSFTERIGFGPAYLIASVATVGLVSLFIAAVLKSRKTAMLFALILSTFYLFIYVIIQLQDQALLFGSIGLFVTVALLMYFSGRINWQRNG